ncbi:MAG: hypothetical protein L3J57_04575 [Desulfuromusa sp.]|nr:hypothetical protein [Desulfuromusa sp.]
MSQKTCYCFNYTEDDIREDVLNNNGKSLILAEIIAAKQQSACECAVHHPENR